MNYAILRFKKIKSFQSIKAHERHINRSKETPNANLNIKNVTVIGDCESILNSVKKRLEGVKTRKGSVLLLEVVCAFSKGYMNDMTPEKLQAWVDASTNFVKDLFPAENCIVSGQLHLDELVPHLHYSVVPIDEKGKLNCRHFLNGKNRLSEIQDLYYENYMKNLGLSRGVKGSKARHQDLQRFYSQLNNPVIDSKENIKAKLLDYDMTKERLSLLENRLNDLENLERTSKEYKKIIRALCKEFDVNKKGLQEIIDNFMEKSNEIEF